MPKTTTQPPNNPRMAAVHTFGHPSAPPPRTGWARSGPRGVSASGVPLSPLSPPPAVPAGPFAPAAPTIVSVTPPPDGTASKLTAVWIAPASDATHDAATGYTLRYRASGTGSWTTVNGATSPYTLTGLSGGAAIDVQVQGTNAAASPGAWSATSTGTTWGATVAAGNWVPASTQTHASAVGPNGGAQLVAVAAPTSVTAAAFAWSSGNSTVPTAGLVAAVGDGQTNGWGQWFNAPASPGTYYLWLLAQGAGGATIGALATGPVTVS